MKPFINNTDHGDEKKRELQFETCPKHGIMYPKGAECPKCAAEREK